MVDRGGCLVGCFDVFVGDAARFFGCCGCCCRGVGGRVGGVGGLLYGCVGGFDYVHLVLGVLRDVGHCGGDFVDCVFGFFGGFGDVFGGCVDGARGG